jgi:CRISPR-associated protein Cas1
MAWRGLHISRSCRLSLADNQCVVAQDTGETRLALEDVAWIVLDTQQATLTGALLAACMEFGITVIVTDARHLPSGVVLPFHRHHRQAEVAAQQVSASDGLRKKLWQALVRGKIRNQAGVLEICAGRSGALRAMAERVTPGDPENIEARAARYYWGRLFRDFVRENDRDRRNAMLNYGYSVMRGAVARGLVAAGLVPALGLHHANALNPFNLADDIIEPFRPIVDLLVWRNSDGGTTGDGDLTLEHRRMLAGVLLETVRFEKEQVTALVASEAAAMALVRALQSGSVAMLQLPEISALSA